MSEYMINLLINIMLNMIFQISKTCENTTKIIVIDNYYQVSTVIPY